MLCLSVRYQCGLLLTGAEVSLVTEEWYTHNLLRKHVVVHALDLQITDANRRGIPCLEYVQVDMEVEDKGIKDFGLFVKRAIGVKVLYNVLFCSSCWV